ncbi:hypothetical protein CDAR_26141 [Caerostris darwini]|uniref:Cytochrome P450 n=1 Tax=Caerostris darwini TaxID=1538125 RepID=A0AAV4N9M1_9ARAC|nr:hypothetical protein CDAR_26141 [Caerostris darwini]
MTNDPRHRKCRLISFGGMIRRFRGSMSDVIEQQIRREDGPFPLFFFYLIERVDRVFGEELSSVFCFGLRRRLLEKWTDRIPNSSFYPVGKI